MKNFLYELLKLSNDVNAVKRGRVPRRVVRRVAGRATGHAFRKFLG